MTIATTTAPRMLRFKILQGSHIEPVRDENGVPLRNSADQPIEKRYHQGQIVSTPVDLHKIFDKTPGLPAKFQPIGEYNYEEEVVADEEATAAEQMMMELQSMDLPALKRFAEDSGLEVPEGANKKKVLALLRTTL